MKIKPLLFFGIFALSAVVLERLCHRATDGFILGHIKHALPYHTEWEMHPKNEASLGTILAQPFHYMGKGAQTYVLVSADGKYILKLFKFHHLAKKEDELKALFASYKLAFDELSEETGLLLVHLNPSSHLQQQLSLVDRLGIVHKIDADATPFILQKRARLVIPTLEDLRLQGNIEGAKEALASLLNLGKKLEAHTIYDHDAHLSKNYGFIGKTPILFDCGNLAKVNHPQTFKAGSLRQWLLKEWPEVSAWFEERVK